MDERQTLTLIISTKLVSTHTKKRCIFLQEETDQHPTIWVGYKTVHNKTPKYPINICKSSGNSSKAVKEGFIKERPWKLGSNFSEWSNLVKSAKEEFTAKAKNQEWEVKMAHVGHIKQRACLLERKLTLTYSLIVMEGTFNAGKQFLKIFKDN